MLELFNWDVGMSALAAVLLVVGAILIGTLAHFIGEVRTGLEGPIVALAALVGGYLGSEAFGSYSTWGYAFEGLYLLPALIGGIVVAAVTDAVVRYVTRGSYVHQAHPI
jgi:uncharacterized membrane protein YeaQ/YmgE (transglycosylase-associated protein family)